MSDKPVITYRIERVGGLLVYIPVKAVPVYAPTYINVKP